MTPTSPAELSSTTASGRRGRGRGVAAALSLLAMAPVGFFYAASGLLVPGPYLYLMWLAYAVLLGAAVWLARRRSYLVLTVPVVGALLWWAVISAGEAWLGWTG